MEKENTERTGKTSRGFFDCKGDRISETIIKTTKAAFNYGRDLIFPMATYCLCCGKYVDSTREYCLCDHCIRHIRWGHINIDVGKEDDGTVTARDKSLDSARACAFYGLYTRRLIFDLKYDGLTYVARVLGDILADRLLSDPFAADILDVDLVVPVPIHKNKLRRRGFNQAEKMAGYMCKTLKAKANIAMGMYPQALVRKRETQAQRSVSGFERYENLKGAFDLGRGAEDHIKDKKILLIDDVYTTGSTGNVCARVLKAGGAKEVHMLALATGNNFAEGFFDQMTV